jgi:hypothetical protein
VARRDRYRRGVRRHHRQSFMDVVERRGHAQTREDHEEAEQKCRRNQPETRKHSLDLDFHARARASLHS